MQGGEAFELIGAGGAATRLEASKARGLTRFVGRENSMAALMEAFEKAMNGTGQVVGIVGEAAVGKSRLLFEFRHQLPQDEFGYLEGHCIYYGGAMPYLPVLDLLRSYFEFTEGEREMILRKKVRERILVLTKNSRGLSYRFKISSLSRWRMRLILSLNPNKEGRRSLKPCGIYSSEKARDDPRCWS